MWIQEYGDCFNKCFNCEEHEFDIEDFWDDDTIYVCPKCGAKQKIYVDYKSDFELVFSLGDVDEDLY